MPPRRTRTRTRRSGSGAFRGGRGRSSRTKSRSRQRSQSKRDSQRRREQRANVREAARSQGRANKILPKGIRDRKAAAKSMQSVGVGSLSGMTGLGGKAERLNLEYKNPNTGDDRKKQIVKELKDVRSNINKQNKELAFKNLLDRTKTNKGLVARDSSGNIITDSSGNPIMSGAGKAVFDQTRRAGFKNPTEHLYKTNPELYSRMYPIQAMLGSGGTLGMLSKLLTKGKSGAKDIGQGIMGSSVVQDLAAAPGGFLGDAKTMLGDLGGIFGGGISGGTQQPSSAVNQYHQEQLQSRPPGGYSSARMGGMEDRSSSLQPDGFIDENGDGVDDRYQPYAGTGFQVGQIGGIHPALTPASALANAIVPGQATPGIEAPSQELQFNQDTLRPFFERGLGSFRFS
jgi:hypothetical protein